MLEQASGIPVGNKIGRDLYALTPCSMLEAPGFWIYQARVWGKENKDR